VKEICILLKKTLAGLVFIFTFALPFGCSLNLIADKTSVGA